MNAHFVAFIANRDLGDTKRAEHHKVVFAGLLGSIMSGADGKTPASAYHVICVPEEYVLLSYLGHKKQSQALFNEGGSKFDILTVTDEKGATQKLYFNIDVVWKGYEKLYKK